jgi:plasmid maintenance system antidote protein VapI
VNTSACLFSAYNEIVNGKRGITPETAWLFGQAFGTSPEFWLNMQSAHDLATAKRPRRTVGKLPAVISAPSSL